MAPVCPSFQPGGGTELPSTPDMVTLSDVQARAMSATVDGRTRQGFSAEIERLAQISPQIIRIFEADAEAEQSRRNAFGLPSRP